MDELTTHEPAEETRGSMHFDALPIGADFKFVNEPGIYCKITADRYQLTGGASARYWISNRHESCRRVIPWHEEVEDLKTRLRDYLDSFLAAPSAEGYRFVRNKLAECYSVSAARQEEAYAREQERLRERLGIREAEAIDKEEPDHD